MADVPDFEELLAALEEDPSKVIQHNAGMRPAHHQELPQIHPNQTGLLQDGINFGTMPTSNMQIGTNIHMSHNQNMSGLVQGMGHGLQRNVNLMGSANVNTSFSSPAAEADAMSVQGGSSLGSLFLSSVDEILSNEKTTHMEFAPPSAQTVTTKPVRARSKKATQRKNVEKHSVQATVVEQNVAMGSQQSAVPVQQMLGNTSGIQLALKVDDHSRLGRGAQGNMINSSDRMQTMTSMPQPHSTAGDTYIATQSPESFARPTHRQQTTQLSRPLSNTSCDNSLYPGSVPQPSPCGSVDSNFAPRTPLSNNPLTPQSLHRPPTPQSNQSFLPNRSASATPLHQLSQPPGMMQEPDFMPGLSLDGPHSPPPIIPDDQSHLQYLNTTASEAKSAELSMADNLLEDLPTPVKNMFQDHFSTPHDFQSGFNLQTTSTMSQISQANWMQDAVVQNAPTFQGDQGSQQFVNFPIDNQSLMTGMTQNYSTNQPSSASNYPSTHFMSSNFSAEQSYDRNSKNDSVMGYGMSDGLTFNQSQILDNLSEWSKSKPRTSENNLKAENFPMSDQSAIGQPPVQQDQLFMSGSFEQTQLAKESQDTHIKPAHQPASNNTVLNMLSTAETGIKQMFSNATAYEAVSPISDYSPACKDPQDNNLHHQATASQGSNQQLSSKDMLQGSGQLKQTHSTDDKTKTGPLARRRSASTERKNNHTTKDTSAKNKPEPAGEFNFEDEFGFDQHEPTIRLPTKRAKSGDGAALPQNLPPEISKPELLASTMQRENYSDQALFDSVQEILALKQKHKSFMEAISHNLKSSPQKSVRQVQQPAGVTTSTSNMTAQPSHQKRPPPPTAAAAPKVSKPKKPSKVSSHKQDNTAKAQVKPHVDTFSQVRTQQHKTVRTDQVQETELFVSQFINQGKQKSGAMLMSPDSAFDNALEIGTTGTYQTSTSGNFSSNMSKVSSSNVYNPPVSVQTSMLTKAKQIESGGVHQPSVITSVSSVLSNTTQLPSKPAAFHAYTNGSSVSKPQQVTPSTAFPLLGVGTTVFTQPITDMSLSSFAPSVTSCAASQFTTKASHHDSTARSHPSNASIQQKAYSSSYDPAISAQTSVYAKTPPTTTFNPLVTSRPLSAVHPAPAMSVPFDRNSEHYALGSKQLDSSNDLFKMLSTPTTSEMKASRSDNMFAESTVQKPVLRTPYSIQPETRTSSSPTISTKSDVQPNTTFDNSHVQNDFLNSLLSKNPAESNANVPSFKSTQTQPTESSKRTNHIDKQSRKPSLDKFPVLPDMSHIHLDYKTSTTPLTATTSLPTIKKTSFSEEKKAVTTSDNVLTSISTSAPSVSTISAHSRNDFITTTQATDTTPKVTASHLTSRSAKDTHKQLHTISHLPDPAQFMHGAQFPDLPTYPFQANPDMFAGFTNKQAFMSNSNPFSGHSMPGLDQAAIQQYIDFFRFTQKRLEGQSADKTFSPASSVSQFSSSVALEPHTAASLGTSTLPTYQQSISNKLSNSYGNLPPPPPFGSTQQSSATHKTQHDLTTDRAIPGPVLSKTSNSHQPSSEPVDSGDHQLPGNSQAPPEIKNKQQTSSLPMDFSMKSSGSETSGSFSAVASTATATSVPSIAPQSKTSTESKVEQSLSQASPVSILKDRTYHGPKKKHILEKYCQQYQKPSSSATSHSLNKVRKPSLDKTNAAQNKHKRHTIAPGLHHNSKPSPAPQVSATDSSSLSTPITLSHKSPTATASTSLSTSQTTAANPVSKASLRNERSSSNKDEESGSIFSVFDSLLQEATECAADSLKNEPIKKKENEPTKTALKENTKQVKESTKQTSKKLKDGAKKSKEAAKIQKDASPKVTLASVTKHASITTPSSTVVSAKPSDTATTTTNRTPATFPFKRRNFHTRNNASSTDTTTTLVTTVPVVQKTTTVSVVAATSNASVDVVQSTTTGTATSAEIKSIATSLETPTSVTETRDSTTPNIESPASVAETKDSSTFKPGGIKLKITAFRSAAGQLIHQSSVMGGILAEELESDSSDQSYRKKKKKKHKKHKKRLGQLSSYDSSASNVIPSVLPKPKTISKIVSSDNNDDDYNPVPHQSPHSSFISSNDSDAGSGSSLRSRKRKKKLSKAVLQPAMKRVRTSSASVDSECEKPKKQRKTIQKKTVNTSKSGPRYKLKSAQGQMSADLADSVPLSFSRPPGKLPLYLNAGANQTVVSGSSQSVPTIQLVPRTITKTTAKSVTSIPVVSPLQSAAKLLSVKLSGSQTKTVQAHIMPKTALGGVRYLLQTSPTAPNISVSSRLIIPKLTSPTFSVGKATVFTVSSSGARVSGTPAIQIHPSPVQTPSSSSQVPSIAPPSQPVIVKRVPVSLLSKSSSILINTNLTPAASKTTVAVSPGLSSTTTVKIPSSVLTSKVFLSPTSTTSCLKLITSPVCSATTPTITEMQDSAQSSSVSKTFRENEFQCAFTKLISSPNPLSKYTPPPLPPQFYQINGSHDLLTYKCHECGDTFLFHSTLMHHYERRSIVVKVRCVQCNQMLVFFNKCEILRHAREHSDDGDVMQFNGANLTPIPLSLCKPRTKEYFLQLAEERKLSAERREKKTSLCAAACTECSFVTDRQETLKEHFQRDTKEWQTCDICRLYMHNPCAFSAHMRMHIHAAPHTCPECGQTFDGNKMDFNLHLRIQCFHLSRASCFKCKLCNLTFLTDDQLRHHLRLNHVQIFYKCRECPMAFKTTQNIANHQRSAHNFTPEPTNTLKTIYKCPLCDMVFTDSSHSQQLFVLHKHFDSHINSTRITAYKCYLCSVIFEQKAQLRDHLQKKHEISSLSEVASSMGLSDANSQDQLTTQHIYKDGESRKMVKKSSSDSPKKVGNNIHQLSYETSSKKKSRKRSIDSAESEESSGSPGKRARQPFKIRIKGMKEGAKPPHSNNAESTEAPLSKQTSSQKVSSVKMIQGKKAYPCNECDKVFLSSHSRSSHVRSIHRGIRALYCCTHCPVGTIKFAKRITLVKHLVRIHGINSPQKQDIKIIRTQVPYIAPGTKFDASSVSVDKNGIATPEKAPPERQRPRKKITTRNPAHARARRLAAAAGSKMMKTMRGGLAHSDDSEGSFGEVDEKMVEEGWDVQEEIENKQDENVEVGDVDVAMLNLPEVYTCIKCDFRHSDRVIFQEHIIEHSQMLDTGLSALTMVQCTECGLCFASTASLDKHLHIKHKVKHRALLERYDSKLRAERVTADDSGRNAESNGTSTSNTIANLHRCKVCFRKFDLDSELKTHMRTHGLAFVKSKHH